MAAANAFISMLGKMQSKAKLYIYSIVLSSRPQRTRVQSGACKHRGDGDGVMDRLALGVYTTSSAATVWYKLEHSGRADILLVEDVEQLDKVTMMELLSILNNMQ